MNSLNLSSIVLVLMMWLAATVIVIKWVTGLPIVEVSNATQECVRVFPEEYSCEHLPDRYELVWVQ